MARKQHNVDEVLRSLSKKNGCSISNERRQIEIRKGQTDLGNGSWGKIDFLEKRYGFNVIYQH